jgi:hypothetical protein
MTLTEYFQEALKLEDGDTLLIPCADEREQESTRVRLYTLRRTNRQSSLEISKQKMKDGLGEKLFVAIKKRSEYAGGCILKKDGTTVPLKEKIPAATSLKRMVTMAIKDGLSESEIIDQFQPSFTFSDIMEVLKEVVNEN